MPTFFSRKQYQEITNEFGLGKITSLKRFRKGFQTPKVMVKTREGEFVISRHKLTEEKTLTGKSKESLQYEIFLLDKLPDLPVPHYRATPKGEHILMKGGYGVTVYDLLSGDPPNAITPRMAEALGKFLGKFHVRGSEFRENFLGRRKFYDLTPTMMREMEPTAEQQKNPLLKEVVQEVREGVERSRPPHGLPVGPIHVDVKPENELFEGEKLTGIVDFGNFYIGPFMVDLGKLIMWNCVEKKKVDGILLERCLAGYESEWPLGASERAYLRSAILFAIYSHIWVDLYQVPLHYVPESYTAGLVKTFLPVARELQKEQTYEE